MADELAAVTWQTELGPPLGGLGRGRLDTTVGLSADVIRNEVEIRAQRLRRAGYRIVAQGAGPLSAAGLVWYGWVLTRPQPVLSPVTDDVVILLENTNERTGDESTDGNRLPV